MDATTHSLPQPPRPRRPGVLWLLAALIGIVLGSAALAAALAGGPQEAALGHLAAKGLWIL
jgi:hypothetical protein